MSAGLQSSDVSAKPIRFIEGRAHSRWHRSNYNKKTSNQRLPHSPTLKLYLGVRVWHALATDGWAEEQQWKKPRAPTVRYDPFWLWWNSYRAASKRSSMTRH